MPALLTSLLVKESLVVERTVQLLEHGHWKVLRWIAMILLDLLDVLDSSLDQLLCILLGPMTVVVMMQQYQKATSHVVLMDCVLVLDCGSLLQYQACSHMVSVTVYDNATNASLAQINEGILDWTVVHSSLHLI